MGQLPPEAQSPVAIVTDAAGIGAATPPAAWLRRGEVWS